MHELAERLLKTIRKERWLSPGDRVAAAVSGGADSVALLFLLEELRTELGIVLSVAHVNHKLRGAESDGDERFVRELAARLAVECEVAIAPADSSPEKTADQRAKPNIEAAARELRHNFFCELGERGQANKIVTAHTLDDQAETVLLRIFRGTGIRGLSGIHPRMSLEHWRAANGGTGNLARAGKNVRDRNPGAEIIRPLLGFRRAELRNYLRARGEAWREDSSNSDPSFTRNRIRHRLLPLLAEEFGDSAIAHMAELAEIARAEEEYCAGVEELNPAESVHSSLDAKKLLALPLAIQRRLVRAWIERNAPEASISFALVEEIRQLAHGEPGQKLELPGHLSRRVAQRVIQLAQCSPRPRRNCDRSRCTLQRRAIRIRAPGAWRGRCARDRSAGCDAHRRNRLPGRKPCFSCCSIRPRLAKGSRSATGGRATATGLRTPRARKK